MCYNHLTIQDVPTAALLELRNKVLITACPKQNICKRYTHKKGVPTSEDANAKLYNICNDNYGYKLFLEDEDIVNKEVKEDEDNENQTEHAE